MTAAAALPAAGAPPPHSPALRRPAAPPAPPPPPPPPHTRTHSPPLSLSLPQEHGPNYLNFQEWPGRKRKVATWILGMWTTGLGIPLFAMWYQQQKLKA
mgnify:CR=1 FL=1